MVPADAHGCPACPHPCVGPAVQGSPDTWVNQRPALRVDDPGYHASCCNTNTWTATQGSETVFINGKAAHRQGDQNKHCGGMGKLIEGSPNVMVGGGSSAGSGGGVSPPPNHGGAGGAAGGGATGGAAGGSSSAASGTAGATGSPGGETGAAPASTEPATDGAPEKIAEDQIEIVIINALGVAQAGVAYDLRMPDGSTRDGTTPGDGVIRFSGLATSGTATLVLSEHDAEKGSTTGARTAGATLYRAGGVPANIGAKTTVELQPRIYRGRLTGMLFDTDRTFVKPDALVGMRLVTRMYEEHPGANVLVSGHADSVGGAAYNRELSAQRCDAVSAFLQDDVAAWLAWYRGKPGSHPWGTREDQHMLTALGYYTGPISDGGSPAVTDAVQRFQTEEGLTVDGVAGAETRERLVQKYMASDGTTLPTGTTVVTHGCGETHPADPIGDGADDPVNRRVEVFFFEGPVDPPPVASCPIPAGCAEYPQWVDRTVQSIELRDEPGEVTVTVLDENEQPIANAQVHLSGPTGASGTSDANGLAKIPDLAPGRYEVIARVEDPKRNHGSAEVDVAGGPAEVTVIVPFPIDWALFGQAVDVGEKASDDEETA